MARARAVGRHCRWAVRQPLGHRHLRAAGHGPYYSTLRRIAERLRAYQGFRNARLLHPEEVHKDGPARVYTDVMEVSLQAFRRDRRHTFLGVIVSTMVSERKIFILAAHPFFLPTHLCPDDDALDTDLARPEFEQKWCGLLHPDLPVDPQMSAAERAKRAPDLGRGGQPVPARIQGRKIRPGQLGMAALPTRYGRLPRLPHPLGHPAVCMLPASAHDRYRSGAGVPSGPEAPYSFAGFRYTEW